MGLQAMENARSADLELKQKQILSKKAGKKEGHTYICDCDKKQIVGIVALVIAAVLLIFAVILASGVFGAGKMAFYAGGLAIASMFSFGIAAFLLTPKSPKLTG
jgi:hypothetical protein